jgi:hypothetical protein
MLMQLVLATAMVVAIVIIHLAGLGILMHLLRNRSAATINHMPLTILVGATIGIIAIHTVEIWLYAVMYLALHAVDAFEPALFLSTVTYASIGSSEVLMPTRWRIFGAIEGAVGIIMLGWSTAFLISLLARLKVLGHDWLQPDGRDD